MAILDLFGPIYKGQRRQNHICGEQIVAIGEETGSSNCPNLPVEAIPIDGPADLDALLLIVLRCVVSQGEKLPRNTALALGARTSRLFAT